MSRLVLLAAFLAASVAQAAAPSIYDLPAGKYLIDGAVRAIGPVIAPGGPVVPPPDDPVVPPELEFGNAVKAAVNKIPVSDARHAAAMKLSATYQMLGGQVKDGKIHPTSAVKAAEMICPIALGSDGKAWGGVFAVVNAAVGKAGTPEATAAVFDAAASAVLVTVPASSDGDMEKAAAQYGFDWTSFMAFLMQLLQILLPLIIS
jgi:hypothetical protein